MNTLYLPKNTFENFLNVTGLNHVSIVNNVNNLCEIIGLHYVGEFWDSQNDLTKELFSAFSALFMGVCFTLLIVSPFVGIKNPSTTSDCGGEEDLDGSDDSDSEMDEKTYLYKYSELFEELNEIPREPLTIDEKKALKTKIISETTPKGNVVMCYHFNEKEQDASSFHYYCDDRSIQFNYLDTVARKYVVTYNCPELYLYLKAEIKKGVDQIKAEMEREKDEAKSKELREQEQARKEASVFATFKNYKKADAPEKKMRRLLVGKNRYTRIGNIEDWNITQQPKLETNVKNISFSEYKKQQQVS